MKVEEDGGGAWEVDRGDGLVGWVSGIGLIGRLLKDVIVVSLRESRWPEAV